MERSGRPGLVAALMGILTLLLVAAGAFFHQRLQTLELGREPLNAGIDRAQKDHLGLQAQVRALEADRAAQGKAADQLAISVEALKARLQGVQDAHAQLLARCEKLEARPAAPVPVPVPAPVAAPVAAPFDKEVQALAGALQALQKDRAATVARLDGELAVLLARLEADRKALDDLSARAKAQEIAQGALTKRADEAEEKRLALADRVRGGEAGRAAIEARLEGLHRERFQEIASRLREIKFKLLLGNYHCTDGEIDGTYFFPFQDHFSYLGVDFAHLGKEESERIGLAKGQGLRVSLIHDNSPAKALGFQLGDILLRLDGKPITGCGLPGTCLIRGQWSKRELLPSYVTTFLPGDVVEVEFRRSEAVEKVKATLTCRVCGPKCAFFDRRANE